MHDVQHSVEIMRHKKSEENMTNNEEENTGKGCITTLDVDIEVSQQD